MKKYIYLIQCLLLFSLSLHINSHVQAENNTVYAAPAVWEVRMKAGSSYTLRYKLKSAQMSAVVVPQLVSFTKSPQGEIVYKKADPSMSIELEGGEWGKPLTIERNHELGIVFRSRASLKPQDLYYALLLDTGYETPEPGNITVSRSKRIALPIYISVLGPSHKLTGQIEQWSIEGLIGFMWFGRELRFVDSFSPIQLRLTTSNTGNHFFDTSGRIAINGPTKQSFLLTKKRILAHEHSLLKAQSEPCGSLSECELAQNTLVLKGSYIGIHEARAEVKMGVGNNYQTKSLTFIALPLYHIGAVLLLILLASVYILLSRARRAGSNKKT